MDESVKKNPILVLISSLLFGSSISLIVTKFLIEKFGLNFLSFDMPGVSEKLAFDKTFDILDFAVAGVLSLGFFVLNFYGSRFFAKRFKNAGFNFSQVLLLIFSLTAFLQTHFLAFASKQVLVMVLVFEIVYFFLGWFGKNFDFSSIVSQLKTQGGKIRFQNGIFLGFLFLLITNILTTIPILSLAWLFITPILTLASAGKRLNSFLENFPGFLIVTAILFPNNLTQLLGLSLVLIFSALLIYKFKPRLLLKNWIIIFLNPALIIFLVAFNPAFNVGNFDSVEEGFWLAWVQRLINGDVLYRDVAVYHSPLIPWGMYLFSKFNGFNLYSERLFLHLLQIIGVIIYFFFSKRVIKNTFFAVLTLFLFLAVTSTLVRNNVEIRLGLPLLSLYLFFGYLKSKNWKLLFLSGTAGIIALMTSLEAGLAVLATLVIGLNVFSGTKFLSPDRLKQNVYLAGGIFAALAVFAAYLFLTGSLSGFIEQTSFYGRSFSLGYFNSAMERSVTHSYFHFDVFDEYLDSVTIFWESTKLIFIGFLIYGLYKFFSRQKITPETNQVLITAFFGLILTRVALGRSDWYHLLFVIGLALVLALYALSKLYESKKSLALGLTLLFVLVMARPSVNNAFLNQELFKYQSFGKVFGDYKAYYFDRGAGALVGMEIDTQPMFDLVEYIQLNSSRDDKIFVFPWNPEIYFYTDRKDATRFDTPYAFFSKDYQNQMIDQLKNSKPKYIVLNADMNFGGLTRGALSKVNEYINANYTRDRLLGPYDLLVPNSP